MSAPLFLPFASESTDPKGSLCGLPMTVLQDYLMDSFADDGLCDDLYEPPSESSEGVSYPDVLFDDPLADVYPPPPPEEEKKPLLSTKHHHHQQGVLLAPAVATTTTKTTTKPTNASRGGGGAPHQQQHPPRGVPPSLPPKRRKTSSYTDLTSIDGSEAGTTTTTTEKKFPFPPGGSAPAAPSAAAPRTKTQAQIDRRRDRNRILARRTRLRKKFFFESLQQQVAELERENAALKELMRGHPELAEIANKAASTADLVVSHGGGGDDGSSDGDASAKKATDVLTKNDMTLMRLVQGAQKSFCITDPSLDDNPIVYASQGFLEQTGYALDQVVGRNCRFLQGPLTDAATVTKIRDHVERGRDVGVTILNYRADGTTFWNQLFVAALRDINEKIVNFVGVQIPVPGPEPSDLARRAAEGTLKHPAEPAPGDAPDYAGAAVNTVLCPPAAKKMRRTNSSSSFRDISPSSVAAAEQQNAVVDAEPSSSSKQPSSSSEHHQQLLASSLTTNLNKSAAGGPTPTDDDDNDEGTHIHVLNRLIQLPQRVVQGTDLATVGAVGAVDQSQRSTSA
mmetsp:Transcript_30664/g.98815  ORF Transcript_30664/g.98815 Transcript_30664/m.98815 type:complete len:566 (+) Transcript_30664:179-1876(+)